VKGGIPVGGFRQKVQDTGKYLNITRNYRGLNKKQRVIFFLWKETHRDIMADRISGFFNCQGSGQLGARVKCKMERRDRGDRDGVLTSVENGWERPDFGKGRRPAVLQWPAPD
jgi:hypothetical protein